ncbi:MAG: hypothetical protein R2784_09300 [Saprospiraceae bacterium]
MNKSTFEGLPNDLQVILKSAAARLNVWMLSEFEAKNGQFLNKMKEEGTDFRAFPNP